ncbi:MAG TPA: ABC transporter permease, partial [Candidatus Dormibacteraeota bacterium]|nr:ABC transporter permease [Candidatus Dormibacteraeota bacterium]
MNDLRYALRQLSKNPGFTVVTVLCLALGIGATSGIFSVVNAVLLRPLPYVHPERLSRVYTEFPTFPNGGLRRFAFSAPEYLDLRRDAASWETVEAWLRSAVNLAGEQEPTRVTAAIVTGGMLEMLGVPPLSGRLLARADDEPGAPLTANISFGLWQRVFGGARDIVGREILVNGTKCTVIGVMPKDFRFPPGEVDAPELWVPLQINPARPGSRSSHGLAVLGRLKPGISLAQARDELASLVRQSQQNGSIAGHSLHADDHTLVAYG